MTTLAEKIAAVIVREQAEVDRLQALVDTELAAARQRVVRLQTLATKITPLMETTYRTCRELGMQLDQE